MKILLLAPHDDDIELGCGATVARFIEEQHEILWVVFAPSKIMNLEHMSVIEELGLDKNKCLTFDFPLRHIYERRQELLDKIISIKSNFNPNLVIGPSLNDLHQDHRVIAKEMERAFKKNCSIICYELPWNHISFDVQLLIKLENSHIEKKLLMLKKFKSQIAVRGNQKSDRSRYFSEKFIRGLSVVRGIQMDSDYAEAFEITRWIL